MLTAVRFIKSKKEGEESTVGVELYKKEILEKRLLKAENEYALKNPEADSTALKVLETLIHYIVIDHKLLRRKGRGKEKGKGKDEEEDQEYREEKGKLNDEQESFRSGEGPNLSTPTSNINNSTEVNSEIIGESHSNKSNNNDNKKNGNENNLLSLDDDTYDCSADCLYFKGDVLEALSDCTLVLKRFPILLAQFKILSLGDEVYSVDRYDMTFDSYIRICIITINSRMCQQINAASTF